MEDYNLQITFNPNLESQFTLEKSNIPQGELEHFLSDTIDFQSNKPLDFVKPTERETYHVKIVYDRQIGKRQINSDTDNTQYTTSIILRLLLQLTHKPSQIPHKPINT